jgi:anti-sigma regulatory factor (Ser/Thr protein kinase)
MMPFKTSGASDGEIPIARAQTEIPCDLNELAHAREFVRRVCERMAAPPLDAERVNQLELATTEAISNVVRHASSASAGGPIHVEADIFANRVALTLSYHGEPFDPGTVTPPAFDGSREGGFGVFIIARSVDEVGYERDADGVNRIRLVKRRDGA